MITCTVGSGFGHAVHFLSYYEKLSDDLKKEVACAAIPPGNHFINENVKYRSPCRVYDYISLKTSLEKSRRGLEPDITPIEKNLLDDVYASKILVNDFLPPSTGVLQLFNKNTVKCCIFYGELEIYQTDSERVKEFKMFVLHTANRHDVFFHVNFLPPEYLPDVKPFYIPVPAIARKVTASSDEIKKTLGLKPDEKFILIHRGAAVNRTEYGNMEDLNSAINGLKTDYRIVVSGILKREISTYRSDITLAPVFLNGMNLVNACQLVVSKPGLGIIQDCIKLKKPLVLLPPDSEERALTVRMLEGVLHGIAPSIEKISLENINEAIRRCLYMANEYESRYEKVLSNGADIIARSLEILHKSHKK